jgi:uncharacterized protein (DUF1684 family)
MRIAQLILLSFIISSSALSQDTTAWRDSLNAYWSRLDAEYADSSTSPLKAEDRAHFTHLAHYPFDPSYCVDAAFTPAHDAEAFTMRTSTARLPKFKVYGTLRFALNGRWFTLPVYHDAVPNPHYPNYLFLPFTDLTNSVETYGAGRYLDLEAPLSEHITLDFNKAYNPYCAYNDRYSCPIPPDENHLDIAVRAGVLKFHD